MNYLKQVSKMPWGVSGSSDLADIAQNLKETLPLLEQLLQGTWGSLKLSWLLGTWLKLTLNLLILAWRGEMKIWAGEKATFD